MLLLILVLIVLALYWLLPFNYDYWKKRGVPSPPTSLFFGNIISTLTLSKSTGQLYNEIYRDFPDLLYVGFYKMRQPGIILRDPELIRSVMLQNFNSFHDNDIIVDEKVDPVVGKNPFVAKGEQWKISKSQVSPCFTSKKLKSMFPLVENAVIKATRYLENEFDATGPNGLNTKEFCGKYTIEVVANCAFGLEGNSFENPNSKFRQMGMKVFQPTLATAFKFFLLEIFPSMASVLKVKILSDDVTGYFRNIVNATIKYREDNGVIRGDFLDFMIDLKNKYGSKEFTDDHLLSHSMGFIVDGYDTSSTTMTHVLFELGSNSDVQAKLWSEVQEALKQNGGKLDYNVLHALPYLDAVINETLRRHPPGMVLQRMCTKSFTLPPPRGIGTGLNVDLETGISVIIPLRSMHLEPKYFPEPELFSPERFLDPNKENIVKGTFLPFGDGPRACHGQRFAIMQIKALVAGIVSNFEIKVNKKTRIPLEVNPKSIVTQYKGGIWLNFYKRKL